MTALKTAFRISIVQCCRYAWAVTLGIFLCLPAHLQRTGSAMQEDGSETAADLTQDSAEQSTAADDTTGDPTAAAVEATPDLTDEQRADLELWTSALNQSPGGPQTRETAARRLVDSGWPQAHAVLIQQLTAPQPAAPDVIVAICRAVSESRNPPDIMLAPMLDAVGTIHGDDPAVIAALAQALTVYPHDEVLPTLIARALATGAAADADMGARLSAIAALGKFAEIDAVDGLIGCLHAAQPESVRLAANQALRELTGLAVDGNWSVKEWSQWWATRRDFGREGLLTNAVKELRSRLADFVSRVQALERDQQQLLSELVTSLERQYWLNPTADRPALLVQLLASGSRRQVRLLGLRLVERAVSNAEAVPLPVIDAVAAMAEDSDTQLRAGALRRLALIDSARASALVAQRFGQERDVAVLQAMLSVLTAQPEASAVPGIVTLITDGGPALHEQACQSLIAAARSNVAERETLRQVADILADRALVEEMGSLSDHIQPIDVELLCWTRGSHEMAAVIIRQILTGQVELPEAYLLAAARGTSQADGSLTGELIAAAANPQVFPWAVAAIQKRDGVTIVGLQSLIAMPCPGPTRRLEALNRMVTDLPIERWIEADDCVAGLAYIGLSQRIEWLARVLNVGEGTSNGSTTGTNGSSGQSKRAVCLRLAELHLENCDPASAFLALQAAPAGDSDQARVTSVSQVAQLMQGNLPAAAQPNEPLQIPIPVWIEAIERLLDCDDGSPESDQRLTLLSTALMQRAELPLDDDQLQHRYDRLVQRINERITPVAEDPESVPDDEQPPVPQPVPEDGAVTGEDDEDSG
ncbi:MAG: HEAT repeat domain-containing protein [Planctomycetes bacterium]|nr:HEAT repeat domain-containing protein [Planctomycetota bacterium]NOG55133.1 hypothetical protein [Planctomycetota bacterium]